MNTEQTKTLILQANADIPDNLLDEVRKVLELQEIKHKTEIKRFENVLKKLARWFRKDSDKVDKVDPDAFYIKILWGIHDLFER